MKFLRQITHSGLAVGVAYQTKRSILLSNYLSLILCGGVILLVVTRLIVFHDAEAVPHLLLGLIVFLSPIVLNRLSLSVLSRMILCFGTVGFVWFAFLDIMKQKEIVEATMYDGLRMYLVALSILPYLLFDRKKSWLFLLAVLPALLSILFLEQLMNLAGLGSAAHGIAGGDYQFMQLRTIVAYIVINFGCLAFQGIIEKNDAFNQRILRELREKTEEIETQNDQLILKQQSLNDMNRQLEHLVAQKTENIKQQNERLLKFAYSNAHHLRGPVARLLGLIQLFRMKTDFSHAWFFEKVANEAESIDTITKTIARDLDDSGVRIPEEVEKA